MPKSASASNAKHPKDHSKKGCVCGGHNDKAHREKGKSRYNPKMVRKIKRAARGPFVEVPADPAELREWLKD
jgi:hypothetical protein